MAHTPNATARRHGRTEAGHAEPSVVLRWLVAIYSLRPSQIGPVRLKDKNRLATSQPKGGRVHIRKCTIICQILFESRNDHQKIQEAVF